MVSRISRHLYALNFFMNIIRIYFSCSEVSGLCHIFWFHLSIVILFRCVAPRSVASHDNGAVTQLCSYMLVSRWRGSLTVTAPFISL
jgi:hypothetical protein